MTYVFDKLADFGWTDFFASQLETLTKGSANPPLPVKVVEVHRGQIRVVGPDIDRLVPPFKTDMKTDTFKDTTAPAGTSLGSPANGGENLGPDTGMGKTISTVGDWLLLDPISLQPVRLLRRSSLFQRRAPGSDRRMQLIAANIDTLFIVSSCNQDFNTARLERYLVLASEADVTPVLILTKSDLSSDQADFKQAAYALLPDLQVEVIDARSSESTACLAPFCAAGKTVALVGSSGVGKSTLINTLMGGNEIETQSIREDDAKGRHTTTGRTFYRLPAGGWILDTPGIRGLDVTEAAAGLDEVFADLAELAGTCKFSDCAHASEPGCAVQRAIKSGDLEQSRFNRWQKLAAEEAANTQTIAQRHGRDRAFGKQIRASKKHKKRYRGE
jgi:ribosome biogenesis GTPase / thiamine phosphate phosphatase